MSNDVVMKRGSDPQGTGLERARARRKLFRVLVPNGRLLGGIALFSLSTNLLMLTAPLFMLQVYDRVLTSRSQDTLLVLFLLVSGLYAAQAVIETGDSPSRARAKAKKPAGPSRRTAPPARKTSVAKKKARAKTAKKRR